jgi:hypothetical protein
VVFEDTKGFAKKASELFMAAATSEHRNVTTLAVPPAGGQLEDSESKTPSDTETPSVAKTPSDAETPLCDPSEEGGGTVCAHVARVLEGGGELRGGLEIWTGCDNRHLAADDFELVVLLVQALIEQVKS